VKRRLARTEITLDEKESRNGETHIGMANRTVDSTKNGSLLSRKVDFGANFGGLGAG
jgi:hypothetical protein